MRPSTPWITTPMGWLLAVLALIVVGPPVAAEENRTAVLISTASVDGETVSCGCKTKDLGGIARRATVVNNERSLSETVLLLDAGGFGASKGFDPWLRTEFQWQMMEKLGYDAVTPGPAEMIRGVEKLKELYATAPGIRIVSANVTDLDDNLLWDEYAVFEKAGVTYAVTGVTDEAYYKFNVAKGIQEIQDFGFRDPRASLLGILPELQGKADVVVALLHMSAADSKRLVKEVEGVDVVVVGHNPGYTFSPEREGQTLLVRGGTRGQYASVLKLTLDPKGRIADYNGEGRPLGEGVREDDAFKAVVSEFDKSYETLEADAKTTPGSK